MTILQQIIEICKQPPVYGPVLYAIFVYITFTITKPVYQKFKRSHSGFGTVFNSMTGKPIDLARVRLVDIHGLTVTSAVTDSYGHYRLTGSPGEYTLDVLKPNYTSPSIFLKDRLRCRKYDNVISSQKIKIRDYGIITKDIPLDPISETSLKSPIFNKKILLSDNAQFVILYLSLIFVLYPILHPSYIATWPIFICQLGVSVYRIANFRPAKPQFGTISDTQTNEALEKVIIRLFDASFNRILNTQITSSKGRYAFLVNKGSYYMTLQKEGYKPIRLNFPNITKDSYPLATNVKMKSNYPIQT
jgi:hypothetical protein